MFRIVSFLVLFFWFRTIFAAPAFATNHFFPTAYQSKNACYFTSVNIALEAKYGTKLRLKKVLQVIGFDGKTLATWEFKKNFSDLTHIVIAEYSTKTAFKKLIDRGEPVLVSTEISVVGVK